MNREHLCRAWDRGVFSMSSFPEVPRTIQIEGGSGTCRR
jgi:hypothetical protein